MRSGIGSARRGGKHGEWDQHEIGYGIARKRRSARLQSPETMLKAVLRRMVRGVSTRDYANVIDLTPEGFGVKKSSVSRDFVRAAAVQVKALAERRFDGMHFPVIMIDGVEYAGATMIVAVRITADGTKRVLGLRQGATENATVCVALLEDLQARGLDTSQPVEGVTEGVRSDPFHELRTVNRI
jgi:putative transposase